MHQIWISVLLAGGLAGCACLGRGFYEPHLLGVNTCRVAVQHLPDSFAGARILHLSDLHASAFGEKNKRMTALVREHQPDYIFATGDFINRNRGVYQGFLDFLDGIHGLCPVYFSLGNHESWIGTRDPALLHTFINALEKRGVIVLNDCGATLRRGGECIQIYGLTPERGKNYETVEMDLARITRKLGKAPKGRIIILLAHEPQFFPAYAGWGADLVLSGHFHGGIIRLPILGGVVSPDAGFFPRYDAGLYYENKSAMYVNRGLGCSHVKFRLWNAPEMVLLTLERGAE